MSQDYRWNAEEYARSSQAQQGWAMELIEALRLQGDESVLDIGCGDGKVTAEISRRVPRGSVTGIDSSPDMVERAKASWPSVSNPRLSFALADARSIPYVDRFDVAFSNAALHWVPDQPAVLAGVARALRPSGRLLFQLGGRGNGAAIFGVAEEMTHSAEWSRYFDGFSFPWTFPATDEYRRWCESAGLRVRSVELVPKAMLQPGIDGLAAWIRTTWMPYTARLPEGHREEFIREAAERYAAGHPPDAQGRVEVGMVRLEVAAEKG
jgi:trans-aconitate 2-methyltransferase